MTNPIVVQDHAVIVILNCAFSWGTITDKTITEETNRDKHTKTKSLRVRKTLLPADSGEDVVRLTGILNGFYNGFHSARTYSTPIRGQRILPVAYALEYQERFAETDAAGRAALATLKERFPAAVTRASDLLQGAFNLADYPDVDEIDQYYAFNYRFLPVPKGDHVMSALGKGVSDSVDAYVTEILTTAAADAKDRLREEVARMAERLLTKDGRLFTSMTDAINDLAESLPVIAGLTGDKNLQDLVAEVKATLTGYDKDTLKKNDLLRTQVGQAAADILRRMGG